MAHSMREERVGLGVAIAAHAALFAALLWHAGREPAQVPEVDRMTVSLAEEVSLESTAPDPAAAAAAAVAPVLAAEPEPAPLPEPEPVTQPVRRPVERAVERPAPPRPTPSAARSPQPRQTQRPATGSRLGDDFLRGVGDAARDDRGRPAATFGAAEQASLAQAINRQLKPHWSAPQGPDAELLVTVLSFNLNRDGTLSGSPRVVKQEGINDTNAAQAARHAEQAIRAVRLAAPFDLPDEFYDKWKRVSAWRFDRKL